MVPGVQSNINCLGQEPLFERNAVPCALLCGLVHGQDTWTLHLVKNPLCRSHGDTGMTRPRKGTLLLACGAACPLRGVKQVSGPSKGKATSQRRNLASLRGEPASWGDGRTHCCYRTFHHLARGSSPLSHIPVWGHPVCLLLSPAWFISFMSTLWKLFLHCS